jgi:hypothetical protein
MRSFTLLLAAFVLALAVAASAAAKVTKYTFTDVTFSDGTNGIVYAGVKETNRSILTACNYHSSSGASLGTTPTPSRRTTRPLCGSSASTTSTSATASQAAGRRSGDRPAVPQQR